MWLSGAKCFLKAILNHETLRHLDLAWNSLDCQAPLGLGLGLCAFLPLAQNGFLTNLVVMFQDAFMISKYLSSEQSANLRFLDLSSTRIREAGAVSLSFALRLARGGNGHELEDLRLCCCAIGRKGLIT